MKSRKGEIWISMIIYVMVAVIVMVIVLEAGVPILNSLRDKSSFAKVKDTMTTLDKHIVDIANEGQGSQRVIALDVPKGDVQVQDNKLRWKLETDSKIVEPKSRQDQGNIIIAADVDVGTAETASYYILENSRILVNISKIGDPNNWTSINTSRLINFIETKSTNAVSSGTFKFLLQNNEASATGTGYTKIAEKGTSLTTGVVIAHVNTTSYEYDLKISLDSKADFFRAGIENFRSK